MPRIVTTVNIACPIEQVFDFITTPAHWPDWHVSALAVSGATDHSLRPGEAVTEDVKVVGRRSRGVWTVRERHAPRRWVIAGSIAGGGSAVITYALERKGQGTIFAREVVYLLPRPLALLNRVLIRPRLEAEARESLGRLKQRLEHRGP